MTPRPRQEPLIPPHVSGRGESRLGPATDSRQSTKLERYAVSSANAVSISIIVALRAPRECATMSPGGEMNAVETA